MCNKGRKKCKGTAKCVVAELIIFEDCKNYLEDEN